MPAFGRRRINYNIGEDKLERLDLAKIKSRLSEEEDKQLTTDMRELYERLLPTEAIGKNRHRLVQKLEKLFNDEWPGHNIRVNLFGSSGNLLCSDDSDGAYIVPCLGDRDRADLANIVRQWTSVSPPNGPSSKVYA
jgi:DNA polymerase sigma